LFHGGIDKIQIERVGGNVEMTQFHETKGRNAMEESDVFVEVSLVWTKVTERKRVCV
jgi:hypothetical protein